MRTNKGMGMRIKGRRWDNITASYKSMMEHAKTHALVGLDDNGIAIGEVVSTKHTKGLFTVAYFNFNGPTPYGGSIGVYGYKHRKDGTVGTHQHYIGTPEEILP